jgi:hypothetical protein
MAVVVTALILADRTHTMAVVVTALILADRTDTIAVVVAAQPLADRTHAVTVVLSPKLEIAHRQELTTTKKNFWTAESMATSC